MDRWISKATLFFHLLTIQQVNSSIAPSSKYQILRKDNIDFVLKNLVIRLKMGYLKKRVPRHVTIVGASAEDLRQVQKLFESYPYMLCTKSEICVHRKRFSPGNFVVIFLGDLTVETVKKSVNILPDCKYCEILYISRGIIENKGISLLFKSTVEQIGINSQLAHLDKNMIKFYTNFISKNCSLEVRLILIWTPGTVLNVIDTWSSSSPDFNRCPVILSTLNFVPKMLIEEHENGSLSVAGGIEGKLVLELAKKLNFTVGLRYPSLENRIKYSRKVALLHEVANGKADIGIGRLRPTKDMYRMIEFSTPYSHDCVTWGVPRVITKSDNVVWMEFSWQVWALVGLVFLIICTIRRGSREIDSSINGDQKSIGFVTIVIDIVAIHLGNPIPNVPTSLAGKFLLIISLHYALVITTAYKTSLASILTTDDGSPGIVDAEGIIRANLSVGGASYNLDFLKDQLSENEALSKLIEKFEIINDPPEVMRRLKFDHNFACVSRRSALYYERYKIFMAQEEMTFDVFKDCVLQHQTVMVFRNKSPLRESANDLILGLSQSGILDHWDSLSFNPEEIMQRKLSAEEYLASTNIRDKFHYVFRLYITCNVLCLFIFLTEIATWHLKKY